MVAGILLAGGVGKRMGEAKPKQFVEIEEKPIAYYPLKIMENHPEIDVVEIVCVSSYIDEMWEIVRKYNFSKVRWIVSGGDTCQESTRNGIYHLKDKIESDDIILIHMTSYPIASKEIITSCIASAKENGNGVTARSIPYSVYYTEDKKTTTEWIDRNTMMLSTIPLAFRFGECLEIYEKAYREKRGIEGDVYATTLYCKYGKRLYFSEDSPTNLKITTPEDLDLLKAYLKIISFENA